MKKSKSILAKIQLLHEGDRTVSSLAIDKGKIIRFTEENINDQNIKPVTIISVSCDEYPVAVKKLNLSGTFDKFEDKLIIGIPTKNFLDTLISGKIKVGNIVQSFRKEDGRASCIPAKYLNTNESTKLILGWMVEAYNSATDQDANTFATLFDQKLRDNRVRLQL